MLDLVMINRALEMQVVNLMGMLVVFWSVAVLVLAGPAHLSRQPKVVVEALEVPTPTRGHSSPSGA